VEVGHQLVKEVQRLYEVRYVVEIVVEYLVEIDHDFGKGLEESRVDFVGVEDLETLVLLVQTKGLYCVELRLGDI
jgi:hypothetical protein